MPEEVEPAVAGGNAVSESTEAPKAEESPKPEPAKQEPKPQGQQGKPQGGGGGPRPDRGPRGDQRGGEPRGDRGPRPGGENRGGENRGPRHEGRGDQRGEQRGGDRREGGRPGGGRPFEGSVEIELEKLISDSLYLDNQAHVVVMRMRDMDSGTKSQLRRLYNAVRRAVRAPESERQHQFVMLRARLAYTIARHSLRSLDALERLLLQVTRKNDAAGYERFKDLFEAIVAYNE